MIRLVLFFGGFVAVTLLLLVFQPGAAVKRGGYSDNPPEVSRGAPQLTGAFDTAEPEVTPTPQEQPPGDPRRVMDTHSPAAAPDLRRLTWDSIARLNAATGRSRAPGQPGSLLHSIVRKSLEVQQTPAIRNPAEYIVRPGDTLVSIAQALYDDVNMSGPLFAANQHVLAGPDDLRAGQVLKLPLR
ncbi:LysM peptidoglycan-binding domain-containing protein [Puniceibacterium confluentis]|uniref:LysM peptidoglycan-binding domain-containing protein n=1 Tax=Puniceibacterium confluentis TaxID=1958944 RepID=UPI00164405BA|nr:LysM domain-containing protein [Puniceibacterium confluentis]